MNALRRSIVLLLSALALSPVGQSGPGLMFASVAMALAIRSNRAARTTDVALIFWCSLVLMTFGPAQFESWRSVLITLVDTQEGVGMLL
jgi:hypothetical protein